MNNPIFKNIVWWIGILLLQFILIFFFRPTLVYTPYIYIILLFKVQASFSRTTTLFIAFLLGLLMDSFTNSWGVHTATITFIAFMLSFFTGIFSPQDTDNDTKFSLASIGYLKLTIITSIIYFIYHLLTNILWDFSFLHIGYQLQKSLITTLIATGITLVVYSMLSKETDKNNG